jgi:hypothetical protein
MSSSLLARPGTRPEPSSGATGSSFGTRRRWRPPFLAAWAWRRRWSALWLLPLLALSGIVLRVNMRGAPGRLDDEGTYTAQAYAVERFGELAHYTYWYDHPPLGWLQIAAWTWLTGAFDRLDPAVLAGREAMLVAHLVSVVLLWVLARRLLLSRPAAAGALLIYSLSPLAVLFHRSVYLDNVATPWLLGAFVLALSPRRQLAAFAGSALCFAVAVLSKETYLLLLPGLVWLMWRSAHRETRRYTLTVAGSLLVLAMSSYVLLALLKGELMPGEDRVSLVEAVAYQLFERPTSGSVLEAESVPRAIWAGLDPVLAIAAPGAAVAGLFVRRLRPVAATLLFMLVFMARPGYLPIPYVVAMLPLAVVLVAGTLDAAVRARRTGRPALGVLSVAAGVAGVVAVAMAVPHYDAQLRGLLGRNLDADLTGVQSWLTENVPRDYRLVVDGALWVDLVEAGFPRENVVWFYKLDTDPAVQTLAPGGWRDYDYVVSTRSLRTFPGAFPQLNDAVKNSTVVAVFGEGSDRVEIRRVEPAGIAEAERRAELERAARTASGSELARNPRLSLDENARQMLTEGAADPRVLGLLGVLATSHDLAVTAQPGVPGEDPQVSLLRELRITALDGRPVTAGSPAAAELVALIKAQVGPYAPAEARVDNEGLTLVYPAPAPYGLILPPTSPSPGGDK